MRAAYTNWKNERRDRVLLPFGIYWGVTEYHPEPGWLVRAWDVEKRAIRTFSLRGFRD